MDKSEGEWNGGRGWEGGREGGRVEISYLAQ